MRLQNSHRQTHKTQTTGHSTAQQNGKTISIIDVAIPADVRVKTKYTEKLEKYTDLAHEMKRIWQLKLVKIIRIIIGALEAIPKETEVALEKINAPILRSLQKSSILGTAGILHRVLSFDNPFTTSPENGKKYHRMVLWKTKIAMYFLQSKLNKVENKSKITLNSKFNLVDPDCYCHFEASGPLLRVL